MPTRTGKLKDLAHFDATFFGVHAKQAHVMDPQLRILLELTHEALIDAGKTYFNMPYDCILYLMLYFRIDKIELKTPIMLLYVPQ